MRLTSLQGKDFAVVLGRSWVESCISIKFMKHFTSNSVLQGRTVNWLFLKKHGEPCCVEALLFLPVQVHLPPPPPHVLLLIFLLITCRYKRVGQRKGWTRRAAARDCFICRVCLQMHFIYVQLHMFNWKVGELVEACKEVVRYNQRRCPIWTRKWIPLWRLMLTVNVEVYYTRKC